MATTLGKNAALYVSTDDGTTYTLVGKVLTISKRREQSDDEEINVMGEDAPITQAGDLTGTLDISYLQDLADTTGQNVLRDALEDATTLGVRLMYNPVNGVEYDAKVLNNSFDADANGTGVSRFNRESMSIRLVGAATTYTAP